eukprot:jgi/Hompol1/4307/HPOL_007038-RA
MSDCAALHPDPDADIDMEDDQNEQAWAFDPADAEDLELSEAGQAAMAHLESIFGVPLRPELAPDGSIPLRSLSFGHADTQTPPTVLLAAAQGYRSLGLLDKAETLLSELLASAAALPEELWSSSSTLAQATYLRVQTLLDLGRCTDAVHVCQAQAQASHDSSCPEAMLFAARLFLAVLAATGDSAFIPSILSIFD